MSVSKRPIGVQRLRYESKPALTVILTPQQKIDALLLARDGLQVQLDGLLEALKKDLEAADWLLLEAGQAWEDAMDDPTADRLHLREKYVRLEGAHDMLAHVVTLVERGVQS